MSLSRASEPLPFSELEDEGGHVPCENPLDQAVDIARRAVILHEPNNTREVARLGIGDLSGFKK